MPSGSFFWAIVGAFFGSIAGAIYGVFSKLASPVSHFIDSQETERNAETWEQHQRF
jgi:hypothetical protein